MGKPILTKSNPHMDAEVSVWWVKKLCVVEVSPRYGNIFLLALRNTPNTSCPLFVQVQEGLHQWLRPRIRNRILYMLVSPLLFLPWPNLSNPSSVTTLPCPSSMPALPNGNPESSSMGASRIAPAFLSVGDTKPLAVTHALQYVCDCLH